MMLAPASATVSEEYCWTHAQIEVGAGIVDLAGAVDGVRARGHVGEHDVYALGGVLYTALTGRAPIRLDGGATGLAMGDGALFALDGKGETLLRIDPESGKAVGQPVPVAGGDDSHLTADGGTALVAGGARRTLLRITW
jgi:hypothetical protein